MLAFINKCNSVSGLIFKLLSQTLLLHRGLRQQKWPTLCLWKSAIMVKFFQLRLRWPIHIRFPWLHTFEHVMATSLVSKSPATVSQISRCPTTRSALALGLLLNAFVHDWYRRFLWVILILMQEMQNCCWVLTSVNDKYAQFYVTIVCILATFTGGARVCFGVKQYNFLWCHTMRLRNSSLFCSISFFPCDVRRIIISNARL